MGRKNGSFTSMPAWRKVMKIGSKILTENFIYPLHFDRWFLMVYPDHLHKSHDNFL